MPFVSVLLPVRNAHATLERAARSMLEQTLTDLELIAIDDGSSDGTSQLLAALAEADRRVVVLTTPGSGLVAALNLGLRRSSGAFLSSGRTCAIWGAGAIGLQLARKLRLHGIKIDRLIDVDPRKVGQQIDGARVLGYEQLAGPDGVHLVCAVGAKGERAEIRAFLEDRGWLEGVHFTCAA